VAALFACHRPHAWSQKPDARPPIALVDADTADGAADPVADAGIVDAPPPLDAGAGLLELDVPGYLPAFVSAPSGSTGARPVVVATHGVGDRPDWQCNQWRRLVADRAWVLCPRGIVSERWSTRGDTRWTWHGPVFMKREIDAGLEALAARFGRFVDQTEMVYGGFSYGAANGVAIVAKEAARFPYVVLTEGGADRWTTDLAKDFVKNGGKRVLFVCGQKSCQTEAERVAEMLVRAGVETKAAYGKGEGHGYGGAVAARILEEWSWVTVADPRWN
jgi:predicted esterase